MLWESGEGARESSDCHFLYLLEESEGAKLDRTKACSPRVRLMCSRQRDTHSQEDSWKLSQPLPCVIEVAEHMVVQLTGDTEAQQ